MFKHWHKAKERKRILSRLGTESNHARIMGNKKWAILVIGHTVCRLSADDISKLLLILSNETATANDVMGEVYE